jgi:hypothetical protein
MELSILLSKKTERTERRHVGLFSAPRGGLATNRLVREGYGEALQCEGWESSALSAARQVAWRFFVFSAGKARLLSARMMLYRTGRTCAIMWPSSNGAAISSATITSVWCNSTSSICASPRRWTPTRLFGKFEIEVSQTPFVHANVPAS